MRLPLLPLLTLPGNRFAKLFRQALSTGCIYTFQQVGQAITIGRNGVGDVRGFFHHHQKPSVVKARPNADPLYPPVGRK
jgi:hypothetical protein